MNRRSINEHVFPGTIEPDMLFAHWIGFIMFLYLMTLLILSPLWWGSMKPVTFEMVLITVVAFVWAFVFSKFMSIPISEVKQT